MKKSVTPKAKRAAAKGKAKQEPEPEAAESNELIDLHRLCPIFVVSPFDK